MTGGELLLTELYRGERICYYDGGAGQPLRTVKCNHTAHRGQWLQRIVNTYILPEGERTGASSHRRRTRVPKGPRLFNY